LLVSSFHGKYLDDLLCTSITDGIGLPITVISLDVFILICVYLLVSIFTASIGERDRETTNEID